MPIDENVVAELVRRKVVADTFRRLSPDKKELIYRTAVRLFGEYGYDGLPVNRICREAGISKGSFFQYFESKSHLLEFTILVFDDALENWVAEIETNEKVALARDRLKYFHDAVVANPKLEPAERKFFLFVTYGLDHAAVVLEGVDFERHFRDYTHQIVTRGVKTGEIRGDFDSVLTGSLVSIFVEGLMRQHFTGRDTDEGQADEYLISFLFDGIKV